MRNMRTYVSITVYGLLALDAVEAATVTSQAWANHTVQRFPQAQSESDSTTSRPTTSMYTLPIAPQHKSSETQEVSISKSNATSGTWMSLPPKEPVTSESTSEWTWGTDFIPFTKPPCPVTRKCSEVCESWESCTKNLKTITSYTENISTMTSDIYVLEPWTEALVVTSTRSWVGPGAQYFIDDLAPPRMVECPTARHTSEATTCSETVTQTMRIWTMDAGEISYLWEMVISYHPTTSCPSRGFTITQTTTQTSTYTETTFEKYYTTLTKWITVFEDAMNILSAMPETIAPTVTKSAGDLFLPAHPVASSIQPRTIDKVLNKINSNHVQRRQMGIGLPTFGFDDDISTGWDEESDTRTCGPYYTTYTIDFHTVVTVLTSRVPIVVTKEEYTTTKNEPALGTLAKSPDATSIPKGAVPINSLEPNTPAPTRVVPVPTNPPSGEDKPLPWPLIVTTASAGIGLVLPDGNIVPTGSVATFSGVRVSVPKMFEGAPLTAVFINGNSFPLPPSGNSGKESLQINPSPVPAARILDLLRKERPILFFADGQVLESGGTIMLSNHKITFSEDARTIEVDGILINTLLPIVRDGVIIGGLITLPDGSHIVVTSKSEFVGDSQLWSSMLDMLRPTSSITDITKAFEAEVLATKGDSKTWLIPSSAYLPSETGSELSSTRSIAPARDIKQLKYWILVGIFGLLL